MRFFVRVVERSTQDPQEEAAMLGHRLDSIHYLKDLLTGPSCEYIFKSEDGRTSLLLLQPASLEELDRLIKADPLFPYATVDVVPVVPTSAMVREIQAYLGEEILTEQELAALEPQRVAIDPEGMFVLLAKTQPAFSPLLSLEEQRDIYRRTVIAQRRHTSPIEVSDYNPVGKAEGLLIAKCTSVEAVWQHVRSAEIYPDTHVEMHPLRTLEQSWRDTIARLEHLRPGSTASRQAAETRLPAEREAELTPALR